MYINTATKGITEFAYWTEYRDLSVVLFKQPYVRDIGLKAKTICLRKNLLAREPIMCNELRQRCRQRLFKMLSAEFLFCFNSTADLNRSHSPDFENLQNNVDAKWRRVTGCARSLLKDLQKLTSKVHSFMQFALRAAALAFHRSLSPPISWDAHL